MEAWRRTQREGKSAWLDPQFKASHHKRFPNRFKWDDDTWIAEFLGLKGGNISHYFD
jgi:hypothetical protein